LWIARSAFVRRTTSAKTLDAGVGRVVAAAKGADVEMMPTMQIAAVKSYRFTWPNMDGKAAIVAPVHPCKNMGDLAWCSYVSVRKLRPGR
jgi:hypothetical protein